MKMDHILKKESTITDGVTGIREGREVHQLQETELYARDGSGKHDNRT